MQSHLTVFHLLGPQTKLCYIIDQYYTKIFIIFSRNPVRKQPWSGKQCYGSASAIYIYTKCMASCYTSNPIHKNSLSSPYTHKNSLSSPYNRYTIQGQKCGLEFYLQTWQREKGNQKNVQIWVKEVLKASYILHYLLSQMGLVVSSHVYACLFIN